jgi:hypothetical protein
VNRLVPGAAVLLLSPAFAAAKDALPDFDIPLAKHVLPNGLRPIIHENHKARTCLNSRNTYTQKPKVLIRNAYLSGWRASYRQA